MYFHVGGWVAVSHPTPQRYNQMKLVRHLMQWKPTAALADAYERMLLNGIAGVQNSAEIGSLSYVTHTL